MSMTAFIIYLQIFSLKYRMTLKRKYTSTHKYASTDRKVRIMLVTNTVPYMEVRTISDVGSGS
jgi:hypothetical protein